MDISPQGDATFGSSAATPPPQPHFTPALAKSAAAPGSFSFNSGAPQPTPDKAASRQSPRTRNQGSKPAAEMPKSRFMPQDATDTTTAPFLSTAPVSQPSTAGMAGSAHGAGSAQAQSNFAGSAGSAGTAGSAGAAGSATDSEPAQAQPNSAGTTGASGHAYGFDHSQQGSAGTTGFVPFGAQSSIPNGFGSGSSQAAPSGFFTSASSTAAAAFPFSVPGRPMDSRIKDACAMGFMGINLDSSQGSHQDAQMPTAEASFPTDAAASTSAATAGPSAAWSSATAEPNAGAAKQQMPQASFQFQPAKGNIFSSRADANLSDDPVPTTSDHAPAADPPIPPPFTMGAKATPKQQSQRPMFGSEHLATNLNDKLVLEAELAAARAASAAAAQAPQGTSAETALAPAVPSQQAPAASAQTVPPTSEAAPTPAGNTAFSASNSPAGPAQPATQQPHLHQQDTQQQQQPQQPASFRTASAASMAEYPAFVFGARPAAANVSASRDQHSQPYTFAFGTAPAAGSSAFPTASSQPAGPVPTSHSSTGGTFVFGAKPPAAAQSAAPASWCPPTDTSWAVPRGPASKPAPSANAGVSQSSGWPPASTSAAGQHIPMQFSAGQASSSAALRNGLHSPSGVAKHTGSRSSAPVAGQHSRAVPGSPHARRTARGTPRKQAQAESMPAGVPHGWGPLHTHVDPFRCSQWLSAETPSSAQPAGVAVPQQQVTKAAAALHLCDTRIS